MDICVILDFSTRNYSNCYNNNNSRSQQHFGFACSEIFATNNNHSLLVLCSSSRCSLYRCLIPMKIAKRLKTGNRSMCIIQCKMFLRFPCAPAFSHTAASNLVWFSYSIYILQYYFL